VGVDVTRYREGIAALSDFYLSSVGFGDSGWFERRLSETGKRWGFRYAEEFDSWESPSRPTEALLPAPPLDGAIHPDRTSPVTAFPGDG
jgi:hypothetical protein